MQEITALTKVDYASLFVAFFTVLIGLKAIAGLFKWIINELGIETKWSKKEREEHDLLMQTAKELVELQKKQENDVAYSNTKDKEIISKQQELTDMVIDQRIDDWRWRIIDFSSALSNGRKYNRESFDQIFKIYSKYEKFLKDNKMDNGLVDESIKYAKEKYQESLKNGLFQKSDFI